MKDKKLFTSEAVSEGHPDKICDKIADKILDEALKQDKNSKMAVEATIKDELILIYGEENTKAKLDYERIAKWVLKDIGYNEEYQVLVKVSKQSKEINAHVEQKETCAGDQGIMFGYATNETKELMPMPIMLANKIMEKYDATKKENKILGPDAKCQVTIEYEKNIPKRLHTVILSYQSQLDDKNIGKEIILNVVPSHFIDDDTIFIINTFKLGGSFADSGTTGRKIVADTYGGSSPVGGGCFSSKDPSKVDRSAAYYARYVAKNIVAHNLADKCQIEISYTIGNAKPISLNIETFKTEKVSKEEIYKYVNQNFNFTVQNIIDELNLRKPIYYELCAHGHFGKENYSWENIK